MAIQFFVENISFELSFKRPLKQWIKSIIQKHGFNTGILNFIFTSNANILEINRQYLNHDYFTDIITFDFNSDFSVSGDIFISIETVRDNSKLYETSFEEELHRVMIHGIFHLLGFGDSNDEEKKQMRLQEDNALISLRTKFLPNK